MLVTSESSVGKSAARAGIFTACVLAIVVPLGFLVSQIAIPRAAWPMIGALLGVGTLGAGVGYLRSVRSSKTNQKDGQS
jgi:hypothetical protein